MEASYRTSNGRLVFKLQAGTVKDMFKAIAEIQEVFDADIRCGMCESENTRFMVRTRERFTFYESVCLDCRAKLEYGQHAEGGGLFAKRYGQDKKPLPSRGWSRYDPNRTIQP